MPICFGISFQALLARIPCLPREVLLALRARRLEPTIRRTTVVLARRVRSASTIARPLPLLARCCFPTAAGVSLNIVERFPGNAPNGASNATNHPGAATTAAGLTTISGSTGIVPGFQISLADTHELAKDLILGGSTQTGEYGFAYTVTVQYHNGPVLTTGPLVDIYALTDPGLTGGSFANFTTATQDAATLQIYTAAVPEPSSAFLACTAVAGLLCWRRVRENVRLTS